MRKSRGGKTIKQMECINKNLNKWVIRLDLVEIDNRSEFIEETVSQKPNGVIIRAVMADCMSYLEDNIYKKFSLNGEDMWLDGKSRLLIKNSILLEKNLGYTDTLFLTPTSEVLIPIESALKMLNDIELYSKNIHLVGWRKRREVSQLRGIDNLLSYNFRENYPIDKLTFCF